MGTLTDSLFNVLMSWVRALVSAIWALFSSDHTTVLEFLGKNWLGLALLIVAAGLVIDWIIWLIRWQPYHIWARRARRLLRIADPEEDEPLDERAYMPAQEEEAPLAPEEEAWTPDTQMEIGEEEARRVMDEAESVPDETLGQYPGMRYNSRAAAPQEELDGTRRYAAVHSEGPGAAEVNRRRAEIDAWQQQMQEEARQKAEAERAARAAQAEQERRAAYAARAAEEARRAEAARLAEEERAAREQRLAQEEYERQLAQYEIEKAQYERDLAEYERQKAEYDAAMARQNMQQEMEAAAELEPAQAASPRRRRRAATYSDYVAGETVSELPEPPQWTQMTDAKSAPAAAPKANEKHSLLRSGMAKVAQMMEPEEDEVSGITALPPRVDMNAAYRPAKKPPRSDG